LFEGKISGVGVVAYEAGEGNARKATKGEGCESGEERRRVTLTSSEKSAAGGKENQENTGRGPQGGRVDYAVKDEIGGRTGET